MRKPPSPSMIVISALRYVPARVNRQVKVWPMTTGT